jgi:hypothetical protein
MCVTELKWIGPLVVFSKHGSEPSSSVTAVTQNAMFEYLTTFWFCNAAALSNTYLSSHSVGPYL